MSADGPWHAPFAGRHRNAVTRTTPSNPTSPPEERGKLPEKPPLRRNAQRHMLRPRAQSSSRNRRRRNA
jgi:hypothetical protein